MLSTAILFFSLAILLGLYLLSFVLRNQSTPKGIVFTHGGLAATGLIILIIYSIFNTPSPIISIIIFILAAMGGLTMVYRDLTGKPFPKWMALAHGITAILGLIVLIIFVFHR